MVNERHASALRFGSAAPIGDARYARNQLAHWVSPAVTQAYAAKKVTKMYNWQAEALEMPGVAAGRSLVYSAPTSGGKSLVAELLLVRALERMNGAAIMVLPFVALCAEKAAHLERVLASTKVRVHHHYGNNGGRLPHGPLGVMVCTFEKANSILSRLIETNRLHEISIVVVDELHMLAGASRAACHAR